jgi:hypothetical protein
VFVGCPLSAQTDIPFVLLLLVVLGARTLRAIIRV